MKYLRIICILAVVPLMSSFHVAKYSKFHVKIIVIDPGHGGKDPGAVSGTVQEKDLTLSISLKVGKLINDNFPDLRVIYTRTKDQFVELYDRPVIANKNKANLFVCIHANICEASSAYGTETYTMGIHKNEGNLEVAKRENSVILMENNYKQKYEGFDPNSAEGSIIFSLYQNAYINQSLSLAAEVEKNFKTEAKRYSRGVKQAGFWVLWKTTMPSILIETGFISNPNEKQFLVSDEGQDKIAHAIYDAISQYKIDVDGENQ